MKRKIAMTMGLLVAGLSACFAQGWQKPQLQTTELTAGQECYLYNVKAERFYTEGNAYGTQGSVGEEGLKCKFVKNTGITNPLETVYKLTDFSIAKNSWRTTFVTTNGALFVDGESVTECWWKVVPIDHSSLNIDHCFKLMMAAPNKTYNQENYPGAMMGLDTFEDEYRTALAAILMDSEEPGEGIYLTEWAVVTPQAYEQYHTDIAIYKANTDTKVGDAMSTIFRIYWDGDVYDELLTDVSRHNQPYLEKYGTGRLNINGKNLYEYGYNVTCNGTKGTPKFYLRYAGAQNRKW